jgi:hypothetical protein
VLPSQLSGSAVRGADVEAAGVNTGAAVGGGVGAAVDDDDEGGSGVVAGDAGAS